jgi:hypothetical protein
MSVLVAKITPSSVRKLRSLLFVSESTAILAASQKEARELNFSRGTSLSVRVARRKCSSYHGETLLFRYLAARWKHRGSLDKRYLRMGLGLERRAQALSMYWSDHFSRSRAAQSRWARDCEGRLLTVLGAGPLFDFNTPVLCSHFRSFRMVDANPLLTQYWGRLGVPVEPVLTDITGCVEDWLSAVRTSRGDWRQIMSLIHDLPLKPVQAYSAKTDALLSLNILSQLEVGWQEAIEPVLIEKFGRNFVREHEQEWLEAIRRCSQTLAEQHLAAMERSYARDVLLITDVEYIEYTGRRYRRNRWEAPPVTWSADGWTAGQGIQYEAIPALEGVELTTEMFSRWMPSYTLLWQDNWVWHIAPYGTEPAPHGKLHRVCAFALRLIP